ncbi:hypothetical protein BJX63DRAFT_133304 [Aspergillus granulosus]|uniref:BZIP domain-containing protein n=1 Tax=Aspergillus granulosus TaxID=176169 RepID=A0ABR4GSV8_9EURO
MEDYHTSSQVSSPLSRISMDELNNEMPWRLAYDQGHPSIHHRLAYLNNLCFPLPEDHYTTTHQLKSYHGLDLRLVDHLVSTITPAPTPLLSPVPGSDLEPRDEGSLKSHQSTPSAEGIVPPPTTKRRAQNREAQRRFRQKREEAQRVLEEKISSLEVECKELSEKLSQKSERAVELEGERRELEEQVQELRKQGQMLVRVVVRQPALVESLVSLLPPAVTQH